MSKMFLVFHDVRKKKYFFPEENLKFIFLTLDFNYKRCIVRTVLIWLAVLLGELIPKFDLVMGKGGKKSILHFSYSLVILGVIGGTLTGPLIFILPPLFYTRMLQLERRFDKRMLEESTSQTDLNDTDLLLRSSEYGTLRSPKYEYKPSPPQGLFKKLLKLSRSECILAVFVIAFGIAATFTSTLYNIRNIKSLDQFFSPCIQNISLSYEMIPK